MNSENTFTGEYFYTIDNKGRVNIPAKFRSSLSSENNSTFVLTRGLDPCIVAYPLVEWQKVEKGLRDLSSASTTFRAFIRTIVRYAIYCQFDGQGRVQITANLKEWAAIKKEILIIGVVNKIEIWDPKRLEKLDRTDYKIDPKKFDNLAEKVIL